MMIGLDLEAFLALLLTSMKKWLSFCAANAQFQAG